MSIGYEDIKDTSRPPSVNQLKFCIFLFVFAQLIFLAKLDQIFMSNIPFDSPESALQNHMFNLVWSVLVLKQKSKCKNALQLKKFFFQLCGQKSIIIVLAQKNKNGF